MTIERAADLVCNLEGRNQMDLFIHFQKYFNIQGESIVLFAYMCGIRIAAAVKKE